MNNLKLFAGQIITKSKLTKESKLQLLKFIQYEATDSQIKAFLMDGKITKLNEEAEVIVNERFEIHKTKQLISEVLSPTEMNDLIGGIIELVGLAGLSAAAWTAFRTFRTTIKRKRRVCGTYGVGLARKACLLKLKIDECDGTLNILKKDIKSCKEKNDPQKCIKKHNKAIEKIIKKKKIAMTDLGVLKVKNVNKSKEGEQRADSYIKNK